VPPSARGWMWEVEGSSRAKLRNPFLAKVICHLEQSERPMHFLQSDQLHRFFATLRMTIVL
jgi:hypothetical protein